ncbi:MAG: tetratricopeptide repeat protein [Gemmatimonadaceae bacterium]
MEYRRTLFDRLGPGAADHFNAMRGAIIAGALGAFGGSMYASQRGWHPLLGMLVGGIAAGGAAWLGIMGVSKAAGGALGVFIQSDGTYEEIFSYEDSLLARGNHAAAISSFEKHVAAGTGGATALLRTADLQAQHGNPKRAVELYRIAQKSGKAAPAQHMYATNRLIDIYTGPLPNTDAAVSELRRLIAKHPSSDAAKHARSALVRLKRQLRSESTD